MKTEWVNGEIGEVKTMEPTDCDLKTQKHGCTQDFYFVLAHMVLPRTMLLKRTTAANNRKQTKLPIGKKSRYLVPLETSGSLATLGPEFQHVSKLLEVCSDHHFCIGLLCSCFPQFPPFSAANTEACVSCHLPFSLECSFNVVELK